MRTTSRSFVLERFPLPDLRTQAKQIMLSLDHILKKPQKSE